MRAVAILLIAVIIVFFIYYLTRRQLESFVESSAQPKKMLLEEKDLQTFSGPTIREELMRLDPAFLEQQLDIYGQTRKIFASLIDTSAGLIAGTPSPSASDKRAVVDAIAKETGGERPEFCSKERVEMLLDESASGEGLDRVFKCLPATPGRLMILLSYAARLLKEKLGGAVDMLGGDYASSDDMPSFPIDTRGGSEGFIGGAGAESATDAASASAMSGSGYVSAYALPAVVPRSGSGGSSANPFKSAIENQLDAWKAAFDSESVKRIQLYLRYCNGALKKINGIADDAKSGKLIKKMRFAERVNATNDSIASQIQLPSQMKGQGQSQTSGFQLPI